MAGPSKVPKDRSFGSGQSVSVDILGSIFENIPNMIFLKDAKELRFVTFNRAGEDLLGYSRQQLIGKCDHDFFPKEQADAFTLEDRAVLDRREAVDIPEEPISTPHGERILHTKKVPILAADGTPQFLLGISEDITALKDAERALRERERQLQGLLEAIPDLIFRIDRSGRFLAFIAARGIETLAPEATFIGQMVEDVLPDTIASRARRALERAFDFDEPAIFEYEVGGKDGLRHFEARMVRSGPDDVVALVRDITDWRRAEESDRQGQRLLAHATRLTTMGEMATGIAHEVNQPLAAIVNHAEACTLAIRHGNPSLSQMLDDLSAIARQAERATEIVRHLRTFVRKGGRTTVVVDLNEVIESTLGFVNFEARDSGVLLVTELRPGPLPVSGDPVEFQQVVLNLVRNAIEAMAHHHPGKVHVRSMAADGEAEVLIRDEGPMMTHDDVERFFMPYFSTKQNGLGLGLPISRSIVERHGGRLTGRAHPDGGAEFLIRVPLAGTESSHG